MTLGFGQANNTNHLILKKVTGKNVNIIYLKESDHRLSSDNDLKMITQSIEYIRNLKK